MSLRTIACGGLAALSLVACGSSGSGSGGGSCTPSNTTSLTITATGLSPKAVCVLPGGTVTFQNNDTVAHDIESDATCPSLNLGPIAAGQSKDVTMPTAQTCTFHDAGNPANTAFQGTVAVTTGTATGGGY